MRARTTIALLASLVLAGPAESATTVFLNRCVGNCVFTPGPDDSRTNQSSIVSATSSVSAFAHGDVSFDAVVACVETELAPFDVAVTTVDPGDAPHFEVVVAGIPQQVGLPSGVTAVAPLTCALVPNGIAFSFANLIGDHPEQICAAAAQTVGNLVGLEFVTSCGDAMAFSFCPPTAFLDEDATCGTSAPAPCICGGTTQNSYQRMLATLPEPADAAGAGAAFVTLAVLARHRSA